MKVVEGQMELMEMFSESSRMSSSVASSNMRTFIQAQSAQQALWPDVLPTRAPVQALAEQPTGSIVNSLG